MHTSTISLLAWLIAGNVLAQALPDPTRPPESIRSPAATSAANNSGLQSVFISPTHRVAIINGQTVELGGMIDGAKLVEISQDHVVLRGAEGKKVLSLFEDVTIKLKPAAAGQVHGNAGNKGN